MATNPRRSPATPAAPAAQQAPQEAMPPDKALMDAEVGSRLKDPFEPVFMGVLRPNDSVLREKAGGLNWQIYRDLKRDGKVASGMRKFIATLIKFPYELTPVTDDARGKADAATLKTILDGTPLNTLYRKLLEAELLGWSVVEVVPTYKNGLIVPGQYLQRSPRRFVYVQDDAKAPPELRMLTQQDLLRGEPLPPGRFIVHTVNSEDDNPYGMGLGHQMFWPVYFKRKGITAWSKLVDRFGSPTPWGKFPSGATTTQRSTLRDALASFSNDGWFMTPDGHTVELIESKLTGSITTQQALCEYMDDWISELWLGQQPRGGSGGAQAAAASEREAVRLDLVQTADELLSDTLNNTLIQWICGWNGLAPCKIARKIEPADDKKARSERDKNVHALGFEPTLEYITEHYGSGWVKQAEPKPAPQPQPVAPPAPGPAPKAQFAEGGHPYPDQLALDRAIKAIDPLKVAQAQQRMLAPLLKAIEDADSFEEALANAEAAYPHLPIGQLAEMLGNMMFSAALHGAVSADNEAH